MHRFGEDLSNRWFEMLATKIEDHLFTSNKGFRSLEARKTSLDIMKIVTDFLEESGKEWVENGTTIQASGHVMRSMAQIITASTQRTTDAEKKTVPPIHPPEESPPDS